MNPAEKLLKIFSYTIDVVFAVILLFMVLGIAIGALQSKREKAL